MLKQFVLFFLITVCFSKTQAQQVNVDSLWQLMLTTKTDSVRYRQLSPIGKAISNLPVDGHYVWAKKVLDYGEKNNDLPIKFLGNILFSDLYGGMAEPVKYYEYLTKATIIAESIPDNANYLAVINNFKGSGSSDPVQRIAYYRKAISLSTDESYKPTILMGLAASFLQSNQPDSALTYAQRANTEKVRADIPSSSLLNKLLGRIYLKMDQPDIAYAYFKKGMQQSVQSNQEYYLLAAFSGMATYFTTVKNDDSAVYYTKKPFMFESQEAYPKKVTAAKWLYQYYLKKNANDSALKYLLFYVSGNDSLNSTKKITELQQVKVKEELRERDLELTRQEEKENRNHNIQLAITAIAILSAIILFLLLSRSILVNHKVVEFLNVVVLLVVFEFINLLLHPFLERITHHSPVLMLLALVAIAALIVPLHHRLEKWATKKLVEKNKAIRLTKAKKTIEELEGGQSAT